MPSNLDRTNIFNTNQREISIKNVYELEEFLQKLQVNVELSPVVELDFATNEIIYNIY